MKKEGDREFANGRRAMKKQTITESHPVKKGDMIKRKESKKRCR